VGIFIMAKGIYNVKNPEKYLGDPRKVRFLSSWELTFMVNCDTNPNIIQWGSEEFSVKYWNPVKTKVCSYNNPIVFSGYDVLSRDINNTLNSIYTGSNLRF
jgi:hypothetical protein